MPETRRGSGTVTATTPSVVRRERLHDSWVALSLAPPSASPVKEMGTAFVEDGTTHELLKDLFNGKDGQAQMLESIGIHLTIAGECYLIGRTTRDRR